MGIDKTYDFEFGEDFQEFEGSKQAFSENQSSEEQPYSGDIEDFDSYIEDIDFSEVRGDFKKSFSRVNRKLKNKDMKKRGVKLPPRKIRKPLDKQFGVSQSATIRGGKKQLAKVIVPSDQKVIVEGVSKFILSQNPKDDSIRNIGYYKGEKLNELILTFNNNSAVDFNLEIFNPSMPLDYMYSTSQNINNKVQVAGGEVSYTDVLFNLLANPALLVNAKFVFAGPSVNQQESIPLIVKNKSIAGVQKISPINLNLKIDNMQVASDIIFFDIMEGLNRPFIPDGMDVIQYKVLPGMTVTMAFFYKQVSLKKVMFEEARENKKLL